MLIAASVIVAGPCGESTAEAGKKRRKDGSLEQLRERDPSERWKILQKIWRPLRDEEPSSPAPDSPPLEPAEGSDARPGVTAPAAAELNDAATDVAAAPAERVPHQPVPEAPIRQSIVPDTLPAPASIAEPETQPVWMLREGPAVSVDAPERIASRLQPANDGRRAPESQMQMEGLADAQPKPITSILPYYDYSPDGASPCEFLCPRPDGCPENETAKPCPELVELPDIPFEDRSFPLMPVTWEASNLFSNPLYFEDAALERYGHTHNDVLQPFVSVGKFGVQLVGLPYQMALHPIHEHRYALGWYRPGECAPYKYYLPPWNTKAALTAGAAYTGLFYLIP